MAEPHHILLRYRLDLGGLSVQPRADHQPHGPARRPDRGVVAQLLRQEQVPPARHHADRGEPGQIRLVVVGSGPELIGGLRVTEEVPPEGDRRAGDVHVRGLQRQLAQRPLHPGEQHRIGHEVGQPAALLGADHPGPVQRVAQAGRAVLVERGGDLGGRDVECHRRQRRVYVRRDRPLRVAEVAAARHGDLAVAPRLLPQPRHCRQPVGLLVQERAKLPAGPECAPRALDEDLEAPARQRCREDGPGDAGPAVRRPDEHDRQRAAGGARPVAVPEQHHPVRHRDPDVALEGEPGGGA